MIYRITFGFAGLKTGWAETHAFLNANPDPKTHFPTMQDIAVKRAQLLGIEFAVVGIRISRYANDAGVRTRGHFFREVNFKNTSSLQNLGAEPADVAILVRGDAEPSIVNPQFNANQNQTFLGGPLDVNVDNGGFVIPANANFVNNFSAWRSAMLNTTMGWLASDTLLNIDITTITQNANGTVRLQTETPLLLTLTQGQIYKARIRQVNKGFSPLNGEVLVKVVDTFTMDTRQVIGIPTAQTNGSMRIYRQVQPFIDYGDLAWNAKVGNHKRGRPFGSTPGRARRRIRG